MSLIGVIGAASCSKHGEELAYQIGSLIASGGDMLVCGGKTGIMESACEGALKAGGQTIGILPGTNRHEANRYVTIPIATGIGLARNAIIARASDVLIAIEGSYGTLSEIGLSLNLGKKVICLESWDITKCARETSNFIIATDPHDAYNKAKGAISSVKRD